MFLFRTFFLTLLFTGLGMALGLMVGILTTAIAALFGHHPADMTVAYRRFAIPNAIVFGTGAFLWNVIAGVRRTSKQ